MLVNDTEIRKFYEHLHHGFTLIEKTILILRADDQALSVRWNFKLLFLGEVSAAE